MRQTDVCAKSYKYKHTEKKELIAYNKKLIAIKLYLNLKI